MIVYHIEEEGGKVKTIKYSGDISLIGASVVYQNNGRKVKTEKATIFDDTATPPVLIREKVELSELRTLGADLPNFYVDNQGNIRNSRGEVIFAGPTDPLP
jgi:hypothetical protein